MAFLGNRGTPGRRRRCQIDLTPLEDRRLLTIGTVTAVAVPKVLAPNDGRYVPVTVSGTVQQVIMKEVPGAPKVAPPAATRDALDAVNESQPGPTEVLGIITDQYRALDGQIRTNVSRLASNRTFFDPATQFNPHAYEVLLRTYDFSFTAHLQAKSHSIGRQYDITVFANDQDGGNQTTIFASVVHSTSHPRPHRR